MGPDNIESMVELVNTAMSIDTSTCKSAAARLPRSSRGPPHNARLQFPWLYWKRFGEEAHLAEQLQGLQEVGI